MYPRAYQYLTKQNYASAMYIIYHMLNLYNYVTKFK